MSVLIIEDDPTLSQNIANALLSEGIAVERIYDGSLAERSMKQGAYDCIILDINLPGIHGFDLCKRFRAFNQLTPVLMLTALNELEDIVRGYECGADDYMGKPFYMRELVLKVKALIKRKQNVKPTQTQWVLKDLIIDILHKKVTRLGTEIPLTPREYQVLITLVEAKGDLVTKEKLAQKIWGGGAHLHTNTIEVYMSFLRNKIDKPFGTKLIKTKVGFGYYIESE